MKEVTAETAAGGYVYSVTYREFLNSQEILDTVEGGDAAVVGIVNASQRQNALQGGKNTVLAAVQRIVKLFPADVREGTRDDEGNIVTPGVVDALNAGDLESFAAQHGVDLGDALDKLTEAVEAHRETALAYTIGKARGAGGLTQKDQQAIGKRVAQHIITTGKQPSQKEMAEIMRELGLEGKLANVAG